MKTTMDIKNLTLTDFSDCKVGEEYVKLYNFMNKQWYSKEEIINAIIEVKKWEYHSLAEDWEVELYKELFIGDKK